VGRTRCGKGVGVGCTSYGGGRARVRLYQRHATSTRSASCGTARQNQSFQQVQPEGPTWRLHIRLLSKMAMRVTSLFVYPIKSCGAIALDEAAITPTGEAIQHGADRVS
jgi:hypothetical protein